MNPEKDLARLEQQLKDAHARVLAGGEDAAQAKIEAQAAADQIRRITDVETAYAPKKQDGVNELGRELAGAGTAALYAGKEGLRNLMDARSERQAQVFAEAIRQANAKPPIPTTVGQFHAPQMVSEYGFGPGAMKNIEHNVSQKMGNPLHASLAEKPIPGFQLEGNRMVITPTSMTSTPPIAPSVAPTAPAAQPSFLEKAKLKGMGLVNKAAPFLGAYGVGSQGMDTLNRYFSKDPIGATISGIGTVGAFVGTKPGPQMIPGLAVSGIAELINKYRDNPQKANQLLQTLGKEMPVMPYAEGGLVGGLSSIPQPSALTAQLAQQTSPQHGLPPVHNLDMLSTPNSSGSRPFNDMYNPNMRYAPPFKEGGSTTPAWQRKEGKSPSGGLNAVGRASYKRETGGELKPPQPEGGSRKKSFCARMGGMKKKLTSSKTANDPDSRINKALRKWKC